ncbi:hypothetical protein V1282_006701 [Nitrobacteraceae bacterium AZCC 2146]
MADVRHVTCAKATDVTSAKASNATAAQATDVTSTKTTHVTAAKAAAHVASATTTMSSASAATAATGLCIRNKQATGQHRTCQNHHHSSSHNILLWDRRTSRHRALSDAGMPEEGNHQRRDGLEMGMLTRRPY